MVRMPLSVGRLHGLRSRAGTHLFEQWKKESNLRISMEPASTLVANMVMHEGDEVGSWRMVPSFTGYRSRSGHCFLVTALITIAATERQVWKSHLSTLVLPTMRPLSFERFGLDTGRFGSWSFDGRTTRFVKADGCWDWSLCSSERCVFPTLVVVPRPIIYMRDANAGCSQSCRWKYDSTICHLGKNARVSSKGKSLKSFRCRCGYVDDWPYPWYDCYFTSNNSNSSHCNELLQAKVDAIWKVLRIRSH